MVSLVSPGGKSVTTTNNITDLSRLPQENNYKLREMLCIKTNIMYGANIIVLIVDI